MENKKLIYAVDDDSSIRELYSCALETDFICETFVKEEELFIALKKKKCDLILLDLMLEGKDGYDILNELKANGFYKDIPVIMVSAKGSEVNKVKGLNYGADDYISKPFGVMELVARINANLRKTHQTPTVISFKDLEFNSELHEILLNKTKLMLTLKEFNLLKYFILNPNKVISKEELFTTIWGEDNSLETRTLDIHINTLRSKVKNSECKIETIRGIGYIFK